MDSLVSFSGCGHYWNGLSIIPGKGGRKQQFHLSCSERMMLESLDSFRIASDLSTFDPGKRTEIVAGTLPNERAVL